MPKHFETIAIHSGTEQSSGENAPIVPPIQPSTVFEHRKEGYQEGDRNYIRYSNPNRDQLEQLLADLEGGEACAAFASGVAAVTAVLQSLHPDSHVLAPTDVYSGTRVLINEFAAKWSLEADFVDMTDLEAVGNAIREETHLIILETPSNPMLLITDIEAVCKIAHEHDVLVAVDNTWPTPYNLQPLSLGADLVIHSTTKYLGGHSDIQGGAVIGKNEAGIFARIRNIQKRQGAVPSPHDCWLLCRSIRSFSYRMRGHNENGRKLAEYLNNHPKVTKVYYPGLESHPGHEIAKREMKDFGGMISFQVKGGAKEALKIVAGSKIIRRATSLGGIESTWEQRKSSESEDSPTPENLIRLSVGLEHPDDLLEDLERALG